MSTEQSIDPQLLEETKQQIRGLVNEVTQLARSDISPQEFYDQFLSRVVQALAGHGGAVWTLGEGGGLQLEYQINLQHTRLHESPEAQQRHGRLLHQIMKSGEGRLVPPHSGGADEEGGNPTECLLVVGPLHSGQEMHGLVEVFQRPGGDPRTQRGYLKFVLRMCELASDYLKTRTLRHLGDRQALWAQLEAFTRAVHVGLDPRSTAYTLANEGRRLIQCDRVSVAIRRGRKCKIEAISGQDTFDKRSNTVVMLNRLATAVTRTAEPMWYSGDATNLAPQVEEALDEYLDESHTKMIAVLPLMRPHEEDEDDNSPQETIGALVVEQIEDTRAREEMISRVDVVNHHGSTALANSLQYNNLFLMPLLRRIGRMQWLIQAKTLPKTLLAAAAVLILLLALVFLPWNFNLEGEGTLQPSLRNDVFAHVDGIVAEVYVEDGQFVEEGAELLRLVNPDLGVQIADIRKKLDTTQSNISTLGRALTSGRLDPAEARQLEAELMTLRVDRQSYENQLNLLNSKAQQLIVRAPTDGQIITWNLQDRLRSRPIQTGQTLLTIADPSGPWELEVLMPEDRMGHIVAAQNEFGENLDVEYILASDPGRTLNGTIEDVDLAADVRGESGNTVMVVVAIDKEDIQDLRPGAGITAKVGCGKRSLGYVLFHDLGAWINSRIIFSWF